MVKAKKFIMVRHFDGVPKPDNFQLVEEDLPELEVGGKCQAYKILKYLLFITNLYYLLCRVPC